MPLSSVVSVSIATVIASFAVACALASPVLASHRLMDWPGAIQKFHVTPTPRIGGIAIYSALLLAHALLPAGDGAQILGTVLVAGLPALAAGLLEDVTKVVGVSARLAATFMSGALACWKSSVRPCTAACNTCSTTTP